MIWKNSSLIVRSFCSSVALAFITFEASASDIMIIHPDFKELNEVATGLKSGLDHSFTVTEHKFATDTKQKEFAEAVKKEKPRLLILFDNTFLSLASRYNQENQQKLPLISVMALNLKEVVKGEKNATGIAYEVPPFLLVTSYNKIIDKKIKRIGVIYRQKLFDWYIKEAKEQLHYEKISLEAIPLLSGDDREKLKDEVKQALSKFKTQKVDAIWLISDNAIINQENMPTLLEFSNQSKIPYLCGVKRLANKDLNLCSYAVAPNNETIVEQGVEQTLAVLKDHLMPSEIKVEYLESVNKYLNLEKLEGNGINVKKDQLDDVEVSR